MFFLPEESQFGKVITVPQLEFVFLPQSLLYTIIIHYLPRGWNKESSLGESHPSCLM